MPKIKVRTLFLSDIHLGFRHARVRELNEFLHGVEAETIVLVGDIVDALSLARRAFWTPHHTQEVRTLLARQRAGIPAGPARHGGRAPQFRYDRACRRPQADERSRRRLMETADLSHHISRRFNEDLERVRSKVLGMGGFVEQQLQKAITALVEGDSSLGESVALDDHQVNNMEIAIDEDCSKILATRAPAAGDLRVIVAIIKTITDLERIGDEGEKIGYIASRLATMERPADKYREIKHLGRVVSEMVHDALDAFARMDVESALRVARQDRLVDEEYEAIQRQSITFMMEDPRTIRRALDVMWVVRALERIGDHAKNISEYVVYMVHGRDIRHTSLDDVERELRAGAVAPAEPPPASA
jgi:phosphate transport system protein